MGKCQQITYLHIYVMLLIQDKQDLNYFLEIIVEVN